MARCNRILDDCCMQFPSSDCQARHRIESSAIEKMSLFGFESFLTHAIFSEHVVSQSAKFLTHNTNNDSVIRWRYKLDAARPGQAGLQLQLIKCVQVRKKVRVSAVRHTVLVQVNKLRTSRVGIFAALQAALQATSSSASILQFVGKGKDQLIAIQSTNPLVPLPFTVCDDGREHFLCRNIQLLINSQISI